MSSLLERLSLRFFRDSRVNVYALRHFPFFLHPIDFYVSHYCFAFFDIGQLSFPQDSYGIQVCLHAV